ncbi:MAG: hypothetical protein B6242_05960 [Anaerolineaceae bacterium 4572_78]|nr:MAG: hypothetical protein B6242_05960 [Anaerolineaceae bacterium 4572_78]
MSEKQCVRALISGRVQGVSMRYYTQLKANELGISGFVRNLRDKRVEAVFEGTPTDIKTMLKWCETGAPHARIDNVQIDYDVHSKGFHGFNIRF